MPTERTLNWAAAAIGADARVANVRPLHGLRQDLYIEVSSNDTSRMLSRLGGVVVMGRSAHRAIAGSE